MKFQILCCVITASTARHGDNTTEPEFSINADVMPVHSAPTPDRNMILNLGHSMIKKIGVPLSSTLISPHIDTYAYKPKSKPCWISPQGWVNANGPPCPVRRQKWQWLGSQNHWLERQSIRSPQVISAQNDNQAHHDVDNNMLEVPLTIKPDVEPFWFPVLPETWSSGAALSPLQCPWFFHFWSQNIQFQKSEAAIRGCRHAISSVFWDSTPAFTTAYRHRFAIKTSGAGRGHRTFTFNSDTLQGFEEHIFNGRVPKRMVWLGMGNNTYLKVGWVWSSGGA